MKKNDKIRVDAPKVAEVTESAEAKKSNQTERKGRFSRRSVTKIMFVVSIIFIMISLTYSWFTSSSTAIADNAVIELSNANALEKGELKSEGIINSIAGNGTSFFKPILERELIKTQGSFNLYHSVKGDDYTLLEDNVVDKDAIAKNLFVQDFSLSIRGPHNVYLVDGTNVKAKKASLNYLEGAVRIGIMKFNAETEKYELCLVWIPDVTSLKGGGSKLEEKVTVVDPNGSEGIESEISITSEHGQTVHNGVRYVWGKIDGNNEHNVLIGELDGEAKYRCVMWLDGNDRECNNELLNSDVVATFKFYPESISKNADVTE